MRDEINVPVVRKVDVRMSKAGTLHLHRVGSPRMICGVSMEESKAMTPHTWENETPQFKCARCRAKETEVARPT